MFELSQEELSQLQHIRKTKKDKRIYIKATALLLLNSGYGAEEVGYILGIDGDTVNRYRKKFSEVSLEAYFQDNYVGRVGKLSLEQLNLLEQELNTSLYLTLAEIREHVFHTYGAEYSKEGMRDLVRRLGFRYKKTRTVPCKADPEKQQQWVAKFEQTMAQLAEDEEVYFIDGVHPMHNTRSESAWIKKGQDFEVPANSGRERMNINGAVCIQDPERILIVEADRISFQANIELFEKIQQERPGKRIIIYADNAKYNHAVALKAWCDAQNGRIEVRYLPPYSPNLNPIERLWKFMKREAINSFFYKTFQEFRTGIRTFFENISVHSEKLKTLISPKFQIIG